MQAGRFVQHTESRGKEPQKHQEGVVHTKPDAKRPPVCHAWILEVAGGRHVCGVCLWGVAVNGHISCINENYCRILCKLYDHTGLCILRFVTVINEGFYSATSAVFLVHLQNKQKLVSFRIGEPSPWSQGNTSLLLLMALLIPEWRARKAKDQLSTYWIIHNRT